MVLSILITFEPAESISRLVRIILQCIPALNLLTRAPRILTYRFLLLKILLNFHGIRRRLLLDLLQIIMLLLQLLLLLG